MEEGGNGIENIIKVSISVQPGSSIVKTVILVYNESLVKKYLEKVWWRQTILATKELTLEIVHSNNTEDNEEQERDYDHIKDVWYCHEQSLNTYFQTLVSADNPNRPNYLQESEYLENFKLPFEC